MSGRWEQMHWHGQHVRTRVPDALGERDVVFSESTIRAAERATAALSIGNDSLPANWEPLARLLLRTEGIASSSIEGVNAPIVEVAVAEQVEVSHNAGWIADNLATVSKAVGYDGDLTVSRLHEWHRRLMVHSTLDDSMIGSFRTAPGWIGGTSPLDAVFVPSPPERIATLIDELVTYANADHFDPVTQAALVHAQFETIHPYGDGNGRLGRILIGWLLSRRGVIDKLPPPISVMIARDAGGYISGLHLFREGPIERYVRWFADVAIASARQSATMISDVQAILAEWSRSLSELRADSAAVLLVPLLPQSPVLTANQVSDLLGVSDRAGRAALNTLEERGILEQVEVESQTPSRGRRSHYYAATALLARAAAWAR